MTGGTGQSGTQISYSIALSDQLQIGQSALVAILFEFWPEYNSGPLWSEDGESVELSAHGIPSELKDRLTAWNANYDDSMLPFEANDTEWLAVGKALLNDVRLALGDSYEVIVTEPWWGEEPSP